ncbi:MAG: hypothetical protein ABIX46_13155 [Burkholderiaceae bacterium]
MTSIGLPVGEPASAYLGYGLGQERAARIAARRRFVELKADLMCACAVLAGERGASLRHAVRQATEAAELWRLRPAVMDALPTAHPRTPGHHAGLQRRIAELFPDSEF